MPPAFNSYRLTKSGSLNVKYPELAKLLGLSSRSDSVIAFEVPGVKAVLLVRLDPLTPIPEALRRIVEPENTALPALVDQADDLSEEGSEEVL